MAFVEYQDVRYAAQAMATLQGSLLLSSDRGAIRIEYAKSKMAEVGFTNLWIEVGSILSMIKHATLAAIPPLSSRSPHPVTRLTVRRRHMDHLYLRAPPGGTLFLPVPPIAPPVRLACLFFFLRCFVSFFFSFLFLFFRFSLLVVSRLAS